MPQCHVTNAWLACDTAGVERPLTRREREVLDALLSVEFDGVEELRAQATSATVVGGCGCGCPSIDFTKERGTGLRIRVNAAIQGTHDGLFLFMLAGKLGGVEYVGVSPEGDPQELPDPSALVIEAV